MPDEWSGFRRKPSEEGHLSHARREPTPGFWDLIWMAIVQAVRSFLGSLLPLESESVHSRWYLGVPARTVYVKNQNWRARRRIRKSGADQSLIKTERPIVVGGRRISYVVLVAGTILIIVVIGLLT